MKDVKKKKKELEEQKELEKKKKLQKRKKYMMEGLALLTIFGTVCLATGCFHASNIFAAKKSHIQDKNEPNIPEPKVADTKDFMKKWNSAIVSINKKHRKNSNYKINFNPYKINKDPQQELKPFLLKNKDKLTTIKQQLLSHKDKKYFNPVVAWIDEQLHLAPYMPKKQLNSRELWKYVASVVSPHKSYSPNTTYKIIELNNFCYFFEKYKEQFYRKGFTRNIKNCDEIQEILDDNHVDLKLK